MQKLIQICFGVIKQTAYHWELAPKLGLRILDRWYLQSIQRNRTLHLNKNYINRASI
ncbi:MAG: hypothetical protein CENE_03555 [Candidatus Celerinatantimonas neptuna]|nr:MAG: hypothetical protein CENE_03555 [Candidatus Celerinatantimonas neptuna]